MFYALAVLTQVMVLVSVIPVTWINGGNSPTVEAQIPLALASVVVFVLGGWFVIFASGIVGKARVRWYRVVAWVLVAFWTFDLAQQLLGTPFERTVMSVVVLLGVLTHLRIAVGNPRDRA
ncbi:MAG: hypothetical protein LBQ06_06240 [Frankiaceae bacterium]|nr:hypothetical protein [Frankiaceae bacterium]